MNILKSFKDMGAMITAAPDMIDSANQMAAQARQMQAQAAAAPVPVAAAPAPENLTPIAGVDITLYVTISKGVAVYNYDAAMLPSIAAAHGVNAADWQLAQGGWTARLTTDPGVASMFNSLYTAN